MAYGSTAMENQLIISSGVDSDAWLLRSRLEAALLLSVVLDAMAAGVIFIFSNTVMPALSKMDSEVGIQAMNIINDIIVNPSFAFVFFGGLVSVYPTLVMWRNSEEHSSAARYYALASTLIFFFGEAVVTVTQNVPRNDVLAAIDPESDAGARYWREEYLVEWVAWNTARGVFAAIASILGAMSLSFMGRPPPEPMR